MRRLAALLFLLTFPALAQPRRPNSRLALLRASSSLWRKSSPAAEHPRLPEDPISITVDNNGAPVKLIYHGDSTLYDGVHAHVDVGRLPTCSGDMRPQDCARGNQPESIWLPIAQDDDATISFTFPTIEYKKV